MERDTTPTPLFIRNLYARMLLTRIVDEHIHQLQKQGYFRNVASCRGYEAAQVGSAVCIEVGKDFTLPYYRDLGVVLTIGMTPYEIFSTYLQTGEKQSKHFSKNGTETPSLTDASTLHWGYQKGNMVAGSSPVATHILHAAGIAFASKLRKAGVVTVAYCGEKALTDPDFLEGISFAAQHQLPVIFICEQACTLASSAIHPASLIEQTVNLPEGIEHRCIEGADITTVYTAMYNAMLSVRSGHGPILLEMCVWPLRLKSTETSEDPSVPSIALANTDEQRYDPLFRCQQWLEEQGQWDETWATQLVVQTQFEVKQAMLDALSSVKLKDK